MTQNIKNIIRSVTKQLGFEIIRTYPRISKRHKTNKPLKIEFIGVSGAGKTTLYKQLVKSRTKKDNWLPLEQFLAHYKNRTPKRKAKNLI